MGLEHKVNAVKFNAGIAAPSSGVPPAVPKFQSLELSLGRAKKTQASSNGLGCQLPCMALASVPHRKCIAWVWQMMAECSAPANRMLWTKTNP